MATIVRDPVHGDIELTGEEIGLIDTQEFQRLRGIKQLGTTSLVFPGATHTRFEHSIGALHMTDRLLDACNRHAARDPKGCHRVTDDERRLLRIAVLLHDVTHIPYGHNIEDQTGLLPRHDEPDRFLDLLHHGELGVRLAKTGLREQVLAILTDADTVPPFWRQIVSDTIDPDLLDYLRRDAHYTGLELRYDDRVLGYFRIDNASRNLFVDLEKNGMLREDTASEILRLLEIRYHFSERVYYHHAKVAAGALLARMVELALRADALTPAQLQRSTDEGLLDHLERANLDDSDTNDRLHRFVRRFRSRRLPKRVLVLPWNLNEGVQDDLLEKYFQRGNPTARFAWEDALESTARAQFGRSMDVILYCPARRMQLKEARTLVRHPSRRDIILPLDHFVDELPRLRDLVACYPRLWKLYVFCSEDDLDTRRTLQSLCLEALPPGCVNALTL